MERNKMKKKGFTLVELLVVIAIIAMLLAILMPALGKVRQIAQRLMCGTNMSGIGKAMMIYANDYDDEYPIAGKGRSGTTQNLINSSGSSGSSTQIGWAWDDPADTPVTGDAVTVSSSLYLLIKFADVSTAQFVCGGGEQKAFELEPTDTGAQNYSSNAACEDVTDCWDFGKLAGVRGPWDYVSYSYQMPYGSYASSVDSSAGLALLADRNPFFDSIAVKTDIDDFLNIAEADLDDSAEMKKGNAVAHQNEGQNVVYGDIHVKFEKKVNVGVQQDNIYTKWTNNPPSTSDDTEVQIGQDPRTLAGNITLDSFSNDDSLLLSDGPSPQ